MRKLFLVIAAFYYSDHIDAKFEDRPNFTAYWFLSDSTAQQKNPFAAVPFQSQSYPSKSQQSTTQVSKNSSSKKNISPTKQAVENTEGLYNNPGKTIGDTVQNLGHAAYCLGKVIEVIADHSPIPSMQDTVLQFTDREYADFSSGPFLSRQQKNYEDISGGCGAILDIGHHVCATIMNKSARQNTADLTEFAADMIIPGKIAQAFIFLSKFIAPHLLDASRSLQQMIPEHFMHEPVGFANISETGDVIAAYMQNTGEFVTSAASAIGKIANFPAIDGITYLQRLNMFEKNLNQLLGPDPEKVKKLKAEFDRFCRSDYLIPGIADIKGVPQIEQYRELTENFTKISNLEPHEVLYLNMCHGLYPYSVRINQRIKDLNLVITEANGTKTAIKEFDIFHTLLGEMTHISAGSSKTVAREIMQDAKNGGHWLYADAKVGTHAIKEIKVLERGYFDLGVKHVSATDRAAMKTFFPYGSTPKDCFDIMLEVIKQVKKPINVSENLSIKSYYIKSKFEQIFALHVKDGVATFYPVNKEFYKGIVCK